MKTLRNLWTRFLSLSRWQQVAIGAVILAFLVFGGRGAGIPVPIPFLPDIR